MTNYGLVGITLTKAEAEWLYSLLLEQEDDRHVGGQDWMNAECIGDKLGKVLGKI
jgi:hypothetical protein